MTTKKRAIEIAKQRGWTEADAKRAYLDIDLKSATEQDILMALLDFAGPELKKRQELQARQKGEVTKKKNQIEAIETDFKKKVAEGERQIEEMHSVLIPIIIKIYAFGQIFGLKDAWIEALIETYKKYSEVDEGSPNEAA
jgi:hypothetical protein